MWWYGGTERMAAKASYAYDKYDRDWGLQDLKDFYFWCPWLW
jgi:hypothetical protein